MDLIRLLIRGIFFVLLGVAFFWGGVSLSVRLPEKYMWVGIVIGVLGVGLVLYSMRYFGLVLLPILGIGVQ